MTHSDLQEQYAPEVRRLAIRDLLVKGLRRHLTDLRLGKPSAEPDEPSVDSMSPDECLHPASSGGAAKNRLFRLYRMDGPRLDTLSEPVPVAQARSGFVYRDRLAIGEATDTFRLET